MDLCLLKRRFVSQKNLNILGRRVAAAHGGCKKSSGASALGKTAAKGLVANAKK